MSVKEIAGTQQRMIESYARCASAMIEAQRRAYEEGRLTFEQMRNANRAIWEGAHAIDTRITDRLFRVLGDYRVKEVIK